MSPGQLTVVALCSLMNYVKNIRSTSDLSIEGVELEKGTHSRHQKLFLTPRACNLQ